MTRFLFTCLSRSRPGFLGQPAKVINTTTRSTCIRGCRRRAQRQERGLRMKVQHNRGLTVRGAKCPWLISHIPLGGISPSTCLALCSSSSLNSRIWQGRGTGTDLALGSQARYADKNLYREIGKMDRNCPSERRHACSTACFGTCRKMLLRGNNIWRNRRQESSRR